MFGKLLLRAHSSNSYEWLVRFSNGHKGYYRQSLLKFDNYDQVTHTLGGNSDSGDLEMSPASSGVLQSSKVVSEEKCNKKNILDYLAISVTNDQEKNNSTKSSHSTYTNIVNLFKPAYPWLTSNILRAMCIDTAIN